MSKLTDALLYLAYEAEAIYDQRQTSIRGEPATPTDPRDEPIDEAVKDVQRLLGGKLTGRGWTAWINMLHAYDDGDDFAYYSAVEDLGDWATAIAIDKPLGSNPPENGPDPNNPSVFFWQGQPYTFTNRNRQMLNALWECRGNTNGIPFLDLGRMVWGEEKQASTIRPQITRLTSQLAELKLPIQVTTAGEVAYLSVAD